MAAVLIGRRRPFGLKPAGRTGWLYLRLLERFLLILDVSDLLLLATRGLRLSFVDRLLIQKRSDQPEVISGGAAVAIQQVQVRTRRRRLRRIARHLARRFGVRV